MDNIQAYRQKWLNEDSKHYQQPAGVSGLAATTTANPYANYALIRDLSHWDDVTIDDLRGYDALIVKYGGSENDKHTNPALGNPYADDKFAKHVQMGWDLDIPVAVYWMVGPRIYLENGYTKDLLFNQTDDVEPVLQTQLHELHAGTGWKGIVKHYWDIEDASLWMDGPNPVPYPWVTFVLDAQRNRFVRRMRTNDFPNVGLGVYSRASFVQQIDQPNHEITTWLNAHPEIGNWCASYPRALPAKVTPAEIRANWLPQATWKPMPLANNTWEIWQFAGSPFDINIYNGTPEQLRKAWGYVSHADITPPTPTPTPDLTALTARVAALESQVGKIDTWARTDKSLK